MGKFFCPLCGHEMIWGSTANRSDVCPDTEQGDTSVVEFYNCPNCGSDVEYYECADSEKKEYTFWNGTRQDIQ